MLIFGLTVPGSIIPEILLAIIGVGGAIVGISSHLASLNTTRQITEKLNIQLYELNRRVDRNATRLGLLKARVSDLESFGMQRFQYHVRGNIAEAEEDLEADTRM